MRTFIATVIFALVVGGAPLAALSQEYDGCNEQLYDSKDEPCGGGHQHTAGARDEGSLERARHRHRYLEDQMKDLTQKVAALTAEVEALKKPAAK